MLCCIAKASAIAESNLRVEASLLPIEKLRELGHGEEAHRHLKRLISTIPHTDGLSMVRALERGARMSFDVDDMASMEQYLDRILATKSMHTRPCDRGFEISTVKRFKADRGLLDPSDAEDAEQRTEAAFNLAIRRAKEAISGRQIEAARSALTEADRHIPDMEEWRRYYAFTKLFDCFRSLGDFEALRRRFHQIEESERADMFDGSDLWQMGFHDASLQSAEKEIQAAMRELKNPSNPNVHMPATRIDFTLRFFIEIGRRDLADRWLTQILKEVETWRVAGFGFASAGALELIAQVTATLRGAAAAESLLAAARQQAKEERDPAWKTGAIASLVQARSQMGETEKALAEIRKMRSPTGRRKALARVFAKARRWKDLRDVLTTAASPAEAADLVWWLHFELLE